LTESPAVYRYPNRQPTGDFKKETITILHDEQHPSFIEVGEMR
jgi:hypothetical protein